MINVAYICADPGVPVFGSKGCSVHVQEGLRALIRLGAHVTLFAQRVGGPAPPDLQNVLVCPLSTLPREGDKERERAAFLANENIARHLYFHGPFDLVYERYSLWNYAGMTYAQNHLIPGILEVNAPLIEEQSRHRVLIHRSTAKTVARRVFNEATTLVAVSEELASYLSGYASESERIMVEPNGVNPDRFRPNLAVSDPDTFTVGFVGSLKPWHGLDVLTAAFDRVRQKRPNARLLIVGDGPERAALEADLEARGCRQLATLTGALPPADVPRHINTMDAAVAPYPLLEDFYFSPLKIVEYMACGVPVAASGIGQVSRLVSDGVTGLLCPPGDPSALAESLIRLHDDAALRTRLGKNARKAIAENHSWECVFARVLARSGVSVRKTREVA